MGIVEKGGDLLEFTSAKVIVQQCNCITLRSHGLSAQIARRLGVDPYALRSGVGNVAAVSSSAQPGTVSLHALDSSNSTSSANFVACLYAQYAPGSLRRTYQIYEQAKRERGVVETSNLREHWFASCLENLSTELKLRGLTRIALPHYIGCGLAGGNWTRYRAMIEQWSSNHPELDIFIVKLE